MEDNKYQQILESIHEPLDMVMLSKLKLERYERQERTKAVNACIEAIKNHIDAETDVIMAILVDYRMPFMKEKLSQLHSQLTNNQP
jgi:hypothetical protein